MEVYKNEGNNESNHYFLLAAPYVPMDGVNEKGLAVGILRIKESPANQKRGKTGITSTTMMQLLQEVSGDSTCWSAIYNQTTPSLLLSVEKDFEKFLSFRNNA